MNVEHELEEAISYFESEADLQRGIRATPGTERADDAHAEAQRFDRFARAIRAALSVQQEAGEASHKEAFDEGWRAGYHEGWSCDPETYAREATINKAIEVAWQNSDLRAARDQQVVSPPLVQEKK